MKKELREFRDVTKVELAELGRGIKSSVSEIGNGIKQIPKRLKLERKYSKFVDEYCDVYEFGAEETFEIKDRLFDDLMALPEETKIDDMLVRNRIREIMRTYKSFCVTVE